MISSTMRRQKFKRTLDRSKCAGWTEVTKELWARIQVRRYKKYPTAANPVQARKRAAHKIQSNGKVITGY